MSKALRYQVQLAPLIDVVFILLAFLLVYSNFQETESLPVQLPNVPEAAANAQYKTSSITITLQQDGKLYIGDKVLERSQWASELPLLLQLNKSANSAEDNDYPSNTGTQTLQDAQSQKVPKEETQEILVRAHSSSTSEELIALLSVLSTMGLDKTHLAVDTSTKKMPIEKGNR